MNFTKLVPNIFYKDIKIGLNLFVDCLGFEIDYDDLSSSKPFCVIRHGDLKAHLAQNEEFALKDRPEIRLETKDIEAVYNAVKTNHSDLLHPNADRIRLMPWNAREFALRDESDLCVVVQQWLI